MSEETMSLRRSLTWGIIAFGVALAVVVGIRLEEAALTVIVGLACGVGASIPTSLLIVALFNRKNEKQKKKRLPIQSPPVVVVTPQALPQTRQAPTWPQEFTLPAPSQRQFSVIGEEETSDL